MTNNALLLTGDKRLTPLEKRILWRLRRLGYHFISAVPDETGKCLINGKEHDMAGDSVIVISSTVPAKLAYTIITCVTTPVVLLDSSALTEMGLTGPPSVEAVTLESGQVVWETPGEKSKKPASSGAHTTPAGGHGYKSGTRLGAGTAAPDRRAVLLGKIPDENLSFDKWTLFDAAIGWAVAAKEFDEVFRHEGEEVARRRAKYYGSRNGITIDYPPQNLVGLALSGGGIRSATFCLGVLQELNRLNLLRIFDYVSTVSGGGFAGGWWSAWLSREAGAKVWSFTPDDFDKPLELCERIEKGRDKFSCYVYSKIDSARRFLIGSLSKSGIRPDSNPRLFRSELKKKLAEDFNNLLTDKSLYSCAKGSRIELVTETDRLAHDLISRAEPPIDSLMSLNRSVLEQAYPGEIRSRGYELFPQPEEVEPKRAKKQIGGVRQPKVAEGSMCAGIDPIHHLRLFSNYLTPRKGLLSADTWRAVGFMFRNMLLTWAIVTPILMAAVLAGQFYFALPKYSNREFFFNYYDKVNKNKKGLEEKLAAIERDRAAVNAYYAGELAGLQKNGQQSDGQSKASRDRLLADQADQLAMLSSKQADLTRDSKESADALAQEYSRILQRRAKQGAGLLILLAGLILVMIITWMRSSITIKPALDWMAHTAGSFGVLALMASAYRMYNLFNPDSKYSYIKQWFSQPGLILVAIIWLIAAISLWFVTFWKHKQAAINKWRKDVRQNKTDRALARLLTAFVITAFVLALSGFGHELAKYLWYDAGPRQGVIDYVAKAGGWATVIAAIGGSIFTAIKTSPSGGQDKTASGAPSRKSLFVLAATPPLVMVVLMVLLSVLAHTLMCYINEDPSHYFLPLMLAAGMCMTLCFFFAIYEMRHWREDQSVWAVVTFGSLAVVSTGLGLFVARLLVKGPELEIPASQGWFNWQFLRDPRFWLLAIIFAVGGAILFRMFALRKPWLDKLRRRFRLRHVWPFVTTGYLALALGLSWPFYQLLAGIDRSVISFWPTAAFVTGLLFCLLATVIEVWLGDARTRRSAWLVAASYAALSGFLILSFFANQPSGVAVTTHMSMTLGFSALGLLTMALAWTLALGWMADPNLLSLHLFYKNRLVCAYMGASNGKREGAEITETAEDDDVVLSELNNCERSGAPYHLINTTLNLVGGRDLATAQRSSASFLLSQRYCGSSRTGFRETSKYMDNRMTVGTATAVSGAAFSPNMGSKNQTAALAMLMTLLNVRLSYWAPTPNKGTWHSPQARLWPFYLFYEFLSQTNDVSSYCCLTDGGHFDNTGLYSLVERGCRYILVIDNGADPTPCFEDLGDAIRRCRIDFGAEIHLPLTTLLKLVDEASKEQLARTHYSVGTINYSREHLSHLGRDPEEINDPSAREGIIVLIKPVLVDGVSADVRQYARQFKDFPQQSTANQWFDEAQFESYRKLGERSAHAAFAKTGKPGESQITKDAEKSARCLSGATLEVDHVEGFFNSALHQFEQTKKAILEAKK